MTPNIKLLKSEKRYYIFNTHNFQLFDINQFSCDVISHFLENNDITETAKYYGIEIEAITSILNKIGFGCYNDSISSEKLDTHNGIIDRITLHVSNDCNLRCKYCYASGGAYGKSRGLMSIETARRFVDYCCENFNKVRNIVFFGGEPFLNYPVIEFVCNSFRDKFSKGDIQTVPRFGAITNGTIQSTKVISLIRDFFSFLTVSVDGPKEINDINRVFVSGHGSYDRINKFLKQITTFKNLSIGIEATYTQQHIDHGYTREMIRNYFLSEFNLNADVVDEMSLDNSNIAIEGLERPFDSPWFDSILRTIIHKVPETKCQILRSTLAISTDGDIYPCHMNIGDGMRPVSSIWDPNTKLNYAIQYDKSYSLKDNDVCRHCWVNNICGGCSRMSFYNPDTKSYSHLPIESKCDDFRRTVEKSLLKICEVRKDPQLWRELVNRVNMSNH